MIPAESAGTASGLTRAEAGLAVRLELGFRDFFAASAPSVILVAEGVRFLAFPPSVPEPGLLARGAAVAPPRRLPAGMRILEPRFFGLGSESGSTPSGTQW